MDLIQSSGSTLSDRFDSNEDDAPNLFNSNEVGAPNLVAWNYLNWQMRYILENMICHVIVTVQDDVVALLRSLLRGYELAS